MKSLTGLHATESAVKSQNLEQYGAGVVFATHGIVDERVPYLQQAALVMTNPELTGEGEASDGFLTMTEVMNLKMPTELVGAMACVTGVGGEVAGEGVMNLGRAFQYAGARSVLVSLWSVEAESTSLLGQHVLEAVKNGKPKDQALLEARRLLREQGYEHPLFWAGFILVGERETGQARSEIVIEKAH
jgi:CHAT domain-containing protein